MPLILVDLAEGASASVAELSMMTEKAQQNKRMKEVQQQAPRRSKSLSSECSMSNGSDPSESCSFQSRPASMLCTSFTVRPGISLDSTAFLNDTYIAIFNLLYTFLV